MPLKKEPLLHKAKLGDPHERRNDKNHMMNRILLLSMRKNFKGFLKNSIVIGIELEVFCLIFFLIPS